MLLIFFLYFKKVDVTLVEDGTIIQSILNSCYRVDLNNVIVLTTKN
jgi:hypothetical protein